MSDAGIASDVGVASDGRPDDTGDEDNDIEEDEDEIQVCNFKPFRYQIELCEKNAPSKESMKIKLLIASIFILIKLLSHYMCRVG